MNLHELDGHPAMQKSAAEARELAIAMVKAMPSHGRINHVTLAYAGCWLTAIGILNGTRNESEAAALGESMATLIGIFLRELRGGSRIVQADEGLVLPS